MPTIQLNIPKITDGNVFKTLWKPRLLFLENTTLPDSWYYGTDSEYNSVTPCTKYKTLGFNYTEIGDSDNLVLNFNNDITYTEDASLSNITLYNKFYKEDIELNLDDNAYLITLKVRLNKNDIRDLDFSKRIYLKDSKIGGGIFRLNSIKKYVPDGLSTVELIKLNYLDASYDSTIVPTNITRTNYSTTEIVSSGGSSSSSSSSSSSINPDNFVLKSGDTMNGGLNVPSLEVTGETFLSGIANASTGYLLYYDPSDDSVTYATTLSGGGGGYVSGDLHVTGELEVDDTIFAYDDFVLDGDLQANGDVYFQGIDASIKDNILYYDPVSNKVFYGSTDSASYWDVSNGKLTYTDNPLFFASALVDDVIEWANGNAIDGDGAHFTNGDGVITCTEFECESFLADEDAVINNQLYLPYLDASVESNVLYYNTVNGNVTYGPASGSNVTQDYVDSSLAIRDASIIDLRNKDTNIDTSLNNLWISQYIQDASIIDLRDYNAIQDASIAAIVCVTSLIELTDTSINSDPSLYSTLIYNTDGSIWEDKQTLDADDYYVQGSGNLGAVNISGIGIAQDGSALVYDGDTSTWIYGVAGGGGLTDISIGGLSDTSINESTLSNENIFIWDSSWNKWTNGIIADASAFLVEDASSYFIQGIGTLGTVDVSSIGTAQDGSALIWSADISTWIFGVAGGSGGSSSLEDLSDTSINADPSSYSSLLYIDSKWIDQETIDGADVFQEKLQYSTPDSSTADGSMGQIAYDDTYLYICTSTNVWKRTILSTW